MQAGIVTLAIVLIIVIIMALSMRDHYRDVIHHRDMSIKELNNSIDYWRREFQRQESIEKMVQVHMHRQEEVVRLAMDDSLRLYLNNYKLNPRKKT